MAARQASSHISHCDIDKYLERIFYQKQKIMTNIPVVTVKKAISEKVR